MEGVCENGALGEKTAHRLPLEQAQGSHGLDRRSQSNPRGRWDALFGPNRAGYGLHANWSCQVSGTRLGGAV